MAATILCVEDEVDLRVDICEELEAAGYNVFQASNGLEALELIQQARPDLVLCDVTMPHMSGLELLEHIRNDLGLLNLPFVLLTALAGHRDVIAGKAAGVDDYLTKPIDFDVMLSTVAKYLTQLA